VGDAFFAMFILLLGTFCQKTSQSLTSYHHAVFHYFNAKSVASTGSWTFTDRRKAASNWRRARGNSSIQHCPLP
jgi:hypothetical protein